MQCSKQLTIAVAPALDCDTIGEASWTLTILDPDTAASFNMAGGDGDYDFNLTGSPGHQGAWYRQTSDTLRCVQQYDATCEIDYDINLTDVGGGSDSSISWQVRRNGILIFNQSKVAPSPGNLTEAGTFSTGPFTMLADTDYTFQIDITIIAIGGGTSSIATGAIRLRPLTPP